MVNAATCKYLLADESYNNIMQLSIPHPLNGLISMKNELPAFFKKKGYTDAGPLVYMSKSNLYCKNLSL